MARKLNPVFLRAGINKLWTNNVTTADYATKFSSYIRLYQNISLFLNKEFGFLLIALKVVRISWAHKLMFYAIVLYNRHINFKKEQASRYAQLMVYRNVYHIMKQLARVSSLWQFHAQLRFMRNERLFTEEKTSLTPLVKSCGFADITTVQIDSLKKQKLLAKKKLSSKLKQNKYFFLSLQANNYTVKAVRPTLQKGLIAFTNKKRRKPLFFMASYNQYTLPIQYIKFSHRRYQKIYLRPKFIDKTVNLLQSKGKKRKGKVNSKNRSIINAFKKYIQYRRYSKKSLMVRRARPLVRKLRPWVRLRYRRKKHMTLIRWFMPLQNAYRVYRQQRNVYISYYLSKYFGQNVHFLLLEPEEYLYSLPKRSYVQQEITPSYIPKKFADLRRLYYFSYTYNLINFFTKFTSLPLTKLLADYMAEQMTRDRRFWPFLNLVKRLFQDICPKQKLKLVSMRIELVGKFRGSARSARRKIYIKQRVAIPLRTFVTHVDYAMSAADTKYGTIGIKIWLYLQADTHLRKWYQLQTKKVQPQVLQITKI